jgi:phosphonate transport system permease protein
VCRLSAALARLPDERLAALERAYAEAGRDKRRRTLLFVGIAIAVGFLAAFIAQIDLVRLFGNLDRFFSYFDRLATFDSGPTQGQRVWTDPAEWFWGLAKWSRLIADTLLIAYAGTVLGVIGGFCLCFAASFNLMPNPWLRGAVKRCLEFCRTVPEIVFALIFVLAFGLGPMPGVLALAIHSTGALGKLFTEIVENIDMKPVEGATASGASWAEVVRFAVVPQVLSNFASYGLLRFEINVRGAAVMGFVGAGGIGQDLLEAIRKFYYADVSAILVLIVITVAMIDIGTERLRHALIGREARP